MGLSYGDPMVIVWRFYGFTRQIPYKFCSRGTDPAPFVPDNCLSPFARGNT